MPKETSCAKADDVPHIDTELLNRKGCFQPYEAKTGMVTWEGSRNVRFGFTFEMHISPHGASYMFVSFPPTSPFLPTKELLSRTVSLLPTNCRYGGVRWWFQCPHCLKRARILYFYRDNILCRKCHGLWYRSQTVERLACLDRKVEKLGAEERWRYYKGRSTRRYKSYLKWKERLDRIEK